jgi:hypothetical protein
MYKQLKNIDGSIASGAIVRVSDGAWIPFDPANSDYQMYLNWLDGYEITPEGLVKTSDSNTPLPADESA